MSISADGNPVMSNISKARAPRNRTVTLTYHEKAAHSRKLLTLSRSVSLDVVCNRIVRQDALVALAYLPDECANLVIVDPPYNRNKRFNDDSFSKTSADEYAAWVDSWLNLLSKKMTSTSSIYICSDWQSSTAIQSVANRYFKIQNRITWEREKGRGAKRNWKNCAEDIWFCTKSDQFTFNIDAVKLSRRVIAPYRESNGEPRDWDETDSGNFRLTHPSNLWTDISVPFWSMPENTDHPTQKPEKLIAKLILASSQRGDVVLDPFAGSGTTAVVAKKTDRRFIAIETDELYCCLAQKRLDLANADSSIQGYVDGVFWERNTLAIQNQAMKRQGRRGQEEDDQPALFVAPSPRDRG
jgi:site-specific DNA-methyltransferase (adenine-specific)